MVSANRIAVTALDDEDRRAEFARVFAQHDRWLYAYLVTLLGNPAHAEEVFQEVCVVLWREYRKFDTSTNFMKWASVIALNQVRRFRRTQRRHQSWLSEGVLDLLADQAVDHAEPLEDRRHALHECLATLRDSDREIVRACYGDARTSIKDAAERLGRPANTVYKAVARIRRVLHECITRRLRSEGLS
ncbi:MAG: sigma-70 family RNA polymerase sigma factor [Planctomycetota bacterium]